MTDVPWAGQVRFPVVAVKRKYDILLGKMLQPAPLQPLDEEIPYFKSASVQWTGVKADPDVRMWASKRDVVKFRVTTGDLLVCEGGDVGRAAMYSGEGGFIFQNSIHRIRAGSDGDLRYLSYVLQAVHGSEWWDVVCNKATIRHLTGEKLGALEIPFPSVAEQRRIADFLDSVTARIDALVAHTEQQIRLVTERLQEVMRLATTCEPPRETKPTGIAWMPDISADWSLRRISRTFTVGSGTTPPADRPEYYLDGDQYWVTSTDVRDRSISETRSKVTRQAISDISSLIVHPPGSLVIAMYGAGATKGRVGLLEIGAVVNQACCVLSNPLEIRPAFAFYWFRAHKEGIIQLASGAGQPNLSAELIKSLAIPTPSRRKQDSIIRQLEVEERAAHHATSLLRERVALLRERRQTLLTAVVTGRIDVTTARGVGVS
ncbi:restriction endonuclease subunit S [Kribbella sp. CA-247076]|uniref:restriction endonuclease subunit S n=1 Tax=Kribbella sp. CA-247076 TaxID=3239941 RepID=UPI003D8DA1AD